MATKEKFEEAKRLYETANADQRYVLESLFPELKESEDERMRKEIISAIKEDWPGHTDWIAWLERQAQKFAWSEEDKNMLKWVIGYLENKMLNTPMSEERTACKNAIAWLLEKQVQKPVDKVEPKFKVGDWISGYYTNYKVLSVNNNGYVVEDVDGNKINILFENEKFHHLWTIQDAKDGDVLSWDNGRYTIIFKELKDNKIVAHCSYNNRSEYFGTKGNYDTSFDSDLKFVPGTKEQRDLLFQKMREAGYEWDNKKKELRKIEQKSAEQNVDNRKLCDIVIKELRKYSGNEVYKAPWALDSTGIQYPLYFAELGVKWQKEQKSAWSKKDARLLDNCISLIEDIDCTEKEQNWLKGIKDRVLQPKQEWSEEDERMCKAVIDNIKAICEEGYFVGNIGSDKLINWFKDLRHRLQWKPSAKQIKALETTLYTNMSRNDERYSVLSEFVAELKKLREE